MTTPGASRSERLLNVIADLQHVVVVTHDNPDPDAIAAGWGVYVLIRKCLGRNVRLVGGGAIVRAENRHLVKLLQPPLELVSDLDIRERTAVILVDCSPEAQNHLLAQEAVQPIAVIDHHVSARRGGRRVSFRDVRPRVAAAASIVSSYLREQGIEPDVRLATALSYGIRTETRGTQTYHSRLDRSIVRWLADYVNPEWMAEIECAPLPRTYFTDLTRALANATLYDGTAFCLLPVASGAEIVGEVADLLIRYDAVRNVLCAARVGGDLVVSVRTPRGGADASVLVRTTLVDLGGGGGGHAQRAGGKIPAARMTEQPVARFDKELKRRWLDACGVTDRTGTPLVLGYERGAAAAPG